MFEHITHTLLIFFSIYSLNAMTVDEFNNFLSQYITTVKNLADKPSADESEKLSEMAIKMFSDLKKKYKNEKMSAENIEFRYKNSASFPDIKEHKIDNESYKTIVLFTHAVYKLFKNLNDSDIKEIVSKSPTEIIVLLKEIRSLLEYASSDPKDYGHGVLTEIVDKTAHVYATDEELKRIMTPTLRRTLIKENSKGQDYVFRCSRITSAFMKNINATKSEVINSLSIDMSDNNREFIIAETEK